MTVLASSYRMSSAIYILYMFDLVVSMCIKFITDLLSTVFVPNFFMFRNY